MNGAPAGPEVPQWEWSGVARAPPPKKQYKPYKPPLPLSASQLQSAKAQ